MKFSSIVVFKRPGHEYSVIGEEVFNKVLDFGRLRKIPVFVYLSGEDLSERPIINSLFVAIGGDGTMLRAMDVSLAMNIKHSANTSVVGFNAGNMGFLTEEPEFKDPGCTLEQIYSNSDGIRWERRLALTTTIDGKEHYAINEFAFTPRNVSAPLTYQIGINSKFVAKHMGSGCMVSTPTGSTAMAMSAGGSIIVPEADVMQIVPIIPHTLSSRPIICNGNDHITFMSDMDRVDEVIISSDGREIATFTNSAGLTVTKAPVGVKVWYSAKRDFFEVLSAKLDW